MATKRLSSAVRMLVSLGVAAALLLICAPPALARLPLVSSGGVLRASGAEMTASHALVAAPLMFVENHGQFDPRARFHLFAGKHNIWLAEDAIWVTVRRSEAPLPFETSEGANVALHLKLSFSGASSYVHLEPLQQLETRVSYFLGSDPAGWRTNLPAWGGVRYVGLYPGLDLEVSGEGGHLAWRLVGGRASAWDSVRLRVEGADGLALDGDRLHVGSALGEFRLPLPEAVTTGRAALLGAPRLIGDEVAMPLATPAENPRGVPPANRPDDLLYATFLGGTDEDRGSAIAVDGAGSAYVTGETWSNDFPTGPGYETQHTDGDVFVVKLTPDGSALSYAALLGGDGRDSGYGIAVGSDGLGHGRGRSDAGEDNRGGIDSADGGAASAYVTGMTSSSDFPAARGPGYDTDFNGDFDAFVVKLSADGSELSYATFLGGSGYDYGAGIALDGVGSAYVTGVTWSRDFPAADGPGYDTRFNGGDWDAFAVKLDPAGSELSYATFLGGSRYDSGSGIAVDQAGSAYVTGETDSSDFPAADGPGYDIHYNGEDDAFVVKLSADGSELVYATFLGGTDDDGGQGIAVDGAGKAYVTGETWSNDFPAEDGPGYTTRHNGKEDAFVVKLNGSGRRLDYATFLGGTDDDRAYSIAVDGAGSAYVTGQTGSGDFPAADGPGYDTSHYGYSDAFVVRLNGTGSDLSYATFLGGYFEDIGFGIAVDMAGNACVTGGTTSSEFPAETGPGYDTSYNGGVPQGGYGDAFVVKLHVKGD